MKARRDEALVCQCGRAVGGFVTDVADEQPITNEDFILDTEFLEPDAPTRVWKCKDCGSVVVRPSGVTWAVLTGRGWIA